MPSLFQDNFDYGDIRRDFVYGVLTSDLLMKNVYCYVAKDGYAARVADTRSYDAVRYVAVAAAFLARLRARARACLCVCLCVRLWVLTWNDAGQQGHPVKMDVSTGPGRQPPRRALVRASPREQVHREGQLRLPLSVRSLLHALWHLRDRALTPVFCPVLSVHPSIYPFRSIRPVPSHPCRTCKIGNNTLIGSHTTVSENASIHASVVGERCTIGPGASLRDAYIFDDTEVGPGCVVEGSIVGSHVRLGRGVRVPRGCIIADGVVIGEGARLRTFERVSKKRAVAAKAADDGSDGDDEDDEDSELDEVEARTSLLSPLASLCYARFGRLICFGRPRGGPADTRQGLERASLAARFARGRR